MTAVDHEVEGPEYVPVCGSCWRPVELTDDDDGTFEHLPYDDLRSRLEALLVKWREDRAGYPTDVDPRAVGAFAAVKVCERELLAVLGDA